MGKFQISWDKGKKKAQPTKDKNRWGAQGKNWAEIPEDFQEPGILGHAAKPGWIKTVQRGCWETQGTRTDVSLLAT